MFGDAHRNNGGGWLTSTVQSLQLASQSWLPCGGVLLLIDTADDDPLAPRHTRDCPVAALARIIYPLRNLIAMDIMNVVILFRETLRRDFRSTPSKGNDPHQRHQGCPKIDPPSRHLSLPCSGLMVQSGPRTQWHEPSISQPRARPQSPPDGDFSLPPCSPSLCPKFSHPVRGDWDCARGSASRTQPGFVPRPYPRDESIRGAKPGPATATAGPDDCHR